MADGYAGVWWALGVHQSGSARLSMMVNTQVKGWPMKQVGKQSVRMFADIVLVVALFLLVVSADSMLGTRVADAALTPWAYLPFISKRGPAPTL